MPNEPIIYDRNVLYEEIWAEPMRTVAERYGVSDVWLAKVCRQLRVPVPGRGYWAKRAAGKAPERTPLPALRNGQNGRTFGFRHEAPPPPELLPGLDEAKPLELPGPIVVPETLENPHKLVAISARYLEKAEPERGVVSAPRRSCLDMAVSPASLTRALRIMDALIKAMEAAGLTVEVAAVEEPTTETRRDHGYGFDPQREETTPQPPERVTRTLCDEEWIQFRLSERVRRFRDQGPPAPDGSRSRWETAYDYEATGELALELTNVTAPAVRAKWHESKKQRLEEMLGEFLAYLPTVALSYKLEREAEKRRRAEERAAQQRRLEEQQRRWEREERQREEKHREEAFEAEAALWRRAQDVRDYVAAALATLDERGLSPENEQSERERLAWALAYADRLDPLRR
jgi:hypothetical protein